MKFVLFALTLLLAVVAMHCSVPSWFELMGEEEGYFAEDNKKDKLCLPSRFQTDFEEFVLSLKHGGVAMKGKIYFDHDDKKMRVDVMRIHHKKEDEALSIYYRFDKKKLWIVKGDKCVGKDLKEDIMDPCFEEVEKKSSITVGKTLGATIYKACLDKKHKNDPMAFLYARKKKSCDKDEFPLHLALENKTNYLLATRALGSWKKEKFLVHSVFANLVEEVDKSIFEPPAICDKKIDEDDDFSIWDF